MNNNKSDKVIEGAKGISLSTEEKSAIRSRIADFVASNAPITSPYLVTDAPRRVAHAGVFSWIMLNQRFVVPAFLFLMIIVGGGASALANKSLPGDALYPVKLNVNETMESVLTFNAKESALVDLNQATRRLSEAEVLAENGKLTPAQDAEIQNIFSQKVESVNNQITKLENKGDVAAANEVREKLEVELDAHEKILTDVSVKSSSTLALLDTVKSKRNKDRKHDDDNGGLAIAEDNASGSARMFAATREDARSKSVERDHEGEDENEDDDSEEGATTFSLTAQTTLGIQATTSATTTAFTMAQVMTHNASTSCYTVIKGSVYDLTKWIKLHPGGSAAILSLCGKDGTTLFLAQHAGQTAPEQELTTLKIGILKQ